MNVKPRFSGNTSWFLTMDRDPKSQCWVCSIYSLSWLRRCLVSVPAKADNHMIFDLFFLVTAKEFDNRKLTRSSNIAVEFVGRKGFQTSFNDKGIFDDLLHSGTWNINHFSPKSWLGPSALFFLAYFAHFFQIEEEWSECSKVYFLHIHRKFFSLSFPLVIFPSL